MAAQARWLSRAWSALEVLLGVIPGLDEAIAQAEGRGPVGLLGVEAVPVAGQGVLHVAYHALRDALHIVADVVVCSTTSEWPWGATCDADESARGYLV